MPKYKGVVMLNATNRNSEADSLKEVNELKDRKWRYIERRGSDKNGKWIILK